jgi:hypothetical protein
VLGLAALLLPLVFLHYWLLDGLPGFVLGVLLREDTVYAQRYSDRGFRAVRVGMSEQEVEHLLGRPLHETLDWRAGCDRLFFYDGLVGRYVSESCQEADIRERMPKAEVVKRFGPPTETSWVYTDSPTDTHYRLRVVTFAAGRVIKVKRGLYLD